MKKDSRVQSGRNTMLLVVGVCVLSALVDIELERANWRQWCMCVSFLGHVMSCLGTLHYLSFSHVCVCLSGTGDLRHREQRG